MSHSVVVIRTQKPGECGCGKRGLVVSPVTGRVDPISRVLSTSGIVRRTIEIDIPTLGERLTAVPRTKRGKKRHLYEPRVVRCILSFKTMPSQEDFVRIRYS